MRRVAVEVAQLKRIAFPRVKRADRNLAQHRPSVFIAPPVRQLAATVGMFAGVDTIPRRLVEKERDRFHGVIIAVADGSRKIAALAGFRHGHPQQAEQGRHQIQRPDQQIAGPAAGFPRQVHEERDAHGGVLGMILRDGVAVGMQVVAVIGSEHDERVVIETPRPEFVDQTSESAVDPAAHGVVAMVRPPDLGGVLRAGTQTDGRGIVEVHQILLRAIVEGHGLRVEADIVRRMPRNKEREGFVRAASVEECRSLPRLPVHLPFVEEHFSSFLVPVVAMPRTVIHVAVVA